MTDRPDVERLVLEDLTDDERRELLAQVDATEAATVGRLGELLSSLEADDWSAAQTPALRFVPEGAGEVVPFWSRMCVRGDAGQHRVAAPVVAAGLAAVIVVAFVAGFVLRGGTDGGPSAAARADARLENAPAVPLVRLASAPSAAGGVARLVPGGHGRVMLRVHGLRPTGKGRWYELWMMRGTHQVVSVGTFRVRTDGTVQTRFRVASAASRYPTMDVSIQTAADGARHSGRSVLRSSPTA